MAINRLQLKKALEGNTKGQTMEQSLKKAKTETEKAPVHQKGGSAKREGMVKRVGRKLRELYYGDKTYMPKDKSTARTKAVVSGLEQAGLTAKEIAKLKGKK